MAISATEFGMRLMEVVGAQVGVSYLSAPISTGYRDVKLMRELGLSKQALREQHPDTYRERVIAANSREASKYAQMARQLGRGKLVVNPAALSMPGWSQPDYMQFWEDTIRSYSLELIMAPGWELSSGARKEVVIALESMLPIFDITGRELSAADLMELDSLGRERLVKEGFDPALVGEYVPYINFEQVGHAPFSAVSTAQQLGDMAEQSRRHVRP